MLEQFHAKPFDDATLIKLDVFRGYIRQWLPVFLTRRTPGTPSKRIINIFDFFAGPGKDAEGNVGSPLIILRELKQFCQERRDFRDANVRVNLYFNDIKATKIDQLRSRAAEEECSEDCCTIHYSVLPFQDAFEELTGKMVQNAPANLVIMDQFGIKDVAPAVLKRLAGIRRTDVLFFMPSSYIRRFCGEDSFRAHVDVSEQDAHKISHAHFHRHICDYFRGQLPDTYFLAPFSIKKRANVFGIIFGSGNLLGLDKFLQVCWSLDAHTGEANYDIDDDGDIRQGQGDLFKEANVTKKQDAFQKELVTYLAQKTRDNREVYRYCLEKGFLPKHARDVLGRLQKEGDLDVSPLLDKTKIRKGDFYLTYEHYSSGAAKVVFQMRGQAHGPKQN